jgi:hypothetical protein
MVLPIDWRWDSVSQVASPIALSDKARRCSGASVSGNRITTQMASKEP